MPDRSSQAGFSLIEILVVVFVIGIIVSIGVMSIGLSPDDRLLRREAARVGSLLEVAQDEAVMQGREFGLEFMRNAYRFVEYDPLQRPWLEVPAENLFRYRELPENVEFDLRLEDKSVELAITAEELAVPDDERDRSERDEYAPHVLIFSSGEATPFELRLHNYDLDQAVILTGNIFGEVEIMTASEEADALLR